MCSVWGGLDYWQQHPHPHTYIRTSDIQSTLSMLSRAWKWEVWAAGRNKGVASRPQQGCGWQAAARVWTAGCNKGVGGRLQQECGRQAATRVWPAGCNKGVGGRQQQGCGRQAATRVWAAGCNKGVGGRPRQGCGRQAAARVWAAGRGKGVAGRPRQGCGRQAASMVWAAGRNKGVGGNKGVTIIAVYMCWVLLPSCKRVHLCALPKYSNSVSHHTLHFTCTRQMQNSTDLRNHSTSILTEFHKHPSLH